MQQMNNRWEPGRVEEIIARHRSRPGPLLPILHDVQQEFGYVPGPAIAMVAHALNLSRAEVWGTFTFYHDFRDAPAGNYVLRVCQAESCQAAGGDRLLQQVEQRLGIKCGDTTDDGRVTLESVYCLGLCHSSPAAMLGQRVFALLDEQRLDAVLAEVEA